MVRPILNRKLVLEAPDRSPDGAGGFAVTWVPLGQLWAEIDARTGAETKGPGAAMSRLRLKITTRAAPHGAASRPKAGQRLREGARLYRILAVGESDRWAQYLVCHAEEEFVR
ncbi:head-tail adaptor protein [Roseisalinus antarcticus]|uniref:Phage head-tail joining protein n=1 Tax=Roseisalinus antarcticus TaxID=254357 RepID=A0A1Y5T7Y5_9RHOB|nr:head-tail adaptor protein [Roseisalinus antarcticus]SLN54487.1 Phage head-tail joining protein [Roseisalinus antarcticus]